MSENPQEVAYMAAARDTMELAERVWPLRQQPFMPESLCIEHLRGMLHTMKHKMSAGKANRYLGWMQCAVVAWNAGPTLEDMKAINTRHRNGDAATKPREKDDGD